ncbi:unnamed protein product [Rotaria magnacalcarata]|uniref:Uncharacterized protein n=1 Tax=Rotaria magnacalcarata TaxID=392030 RepID=A0A816C7S3_9BILA|nr:unnamed protein product [Rotaria magnacalcarata]CAF4801904.1 unnamed protein product [Rotaria magnacalcarata]CAF5038040.1 unnamed protein product [Rotaria magnacalcarata]
MSHLSETEISTINSGNFIEPSTQDKVIPTVSTPTMKRSVSGEIETHTKKNNAAPPPMAFASTATMFVSNNTSCNAIPEISDEELLDGIDVLKTTATTTIIIIREH